MKYCFVLIATTMLLWGCTQNDSKLLEKTSLLGPLEQDLSTIQDTLEDMAIKDQEIRANFSNTYRKSSLSGENKQKFDRLKTQIKEADIKHAMYLETIVDKYGWISTDSFGKRTSRNAWLITQHMVHDDGAFQRKMLSKMIAGENISATNYALLSDRINVVFDKTPQLYGTQGQCKPDGAWQVSEVLDVEKLDFRRQQMGLVAFKEYELRMMEKCSERIKSGK